MQKKLLYFSNILHYYISISVLSSDLLAIELIVKEADSLRNGHPAILQEAQRKKEKDSCCGFCVPDINIFWMTRKQEQAKEGNANGDTISKYHSCFSKTKCDLQKGTLD